VITFGQPRWPQLLGSSERSAQVGPQHSPNGNPRSRARRYLARIHVIEAYQRASGRKVFETTEAQLGLRHLGLAPRKSDAHPSGVKYLCLAYGDEAEWKTLPPEEQRQLLDQDVFLRRRGSYIANVSSPVTVRSWAEPAIRYGPYGTAKLPLVGFSLIDATNLTEAIALVSKTPCAVAGGAIEVLPIVGS
jgi:hypothetical protein